MSAKTDVENPNEEIPPNEENKVEGIDAPNNGLTSVENAEYEKLLLAVANWEATNKGKKVPPIVDRQRKRLAELKRKMAFIGERVEVKPKDKMVMVDDNREARENAQRRQMKETNMQMTEIVNAYLKPDLVTYQRVNNVNAELEARFKQINKTKFDNIIRKLKSSGFHTGIYEDDASEGVVEQRRALLDKLQSGKEETEEFREAQRQLEVLLAKKQEDNTFNYSPQTENVLRIMPEVADPVTGRRSKSHIRVEVYGLENIRRYCRTNMIVDPVSNEVYSGIFFSKKVPYAVGDNKQPIAPVDFVQYNFRVALNLEQDSKHFTTADQEVLTNIIENWRDLKKTFRYICRYSFVNDSQRFRVDCSIVKTSSMSRDKRFMIPAYTIEDAKVFSNPETYEVEIEANPNNKVSAELSEAGIDIDAYRGRFMKEFRHIINIILSGIQRSNFPISLPEMDGVKYDYFDLIYGIKYMELRRSGSRKEEIAKQRETWLEDVERMKTDPRNFSGPSTITLEMHNIQDVGAENASEPNLRYLPYAVTDKADGERKLLYVNSKGRVYLIDNNLNVQFTGATTRNDKLYETLLDGEHVIHDKHGNFINLYAAFDVYFVGCVDYRLYPLATNKPNARSRMAVMNLVVNGLNLAHFNEKTEAPSPLRVSCKRFNVVNLPDQPVDDKTAAIVGAPIEKATIFDACNRILTDINNGLYEYETDGLIFTPAAFGVGMDVPIEVPDEDGAAFNTVMDAIAQKKLLNTKATWKHSFKWKPPKFNTIDFLVTTKKTGDNGKTGEDFIGNVFNGGVNMMNNAQIMMYKTLMLRVGFDERRHGYINPYENMLNDNFGFVPKHLREDTYKPALFYPSSPSDQSAHICNVVVNPNMAATGDFVIQTSLTRDVIEDGSIVEFSYDPTKPAGWRWVPMRVRYDKTEEYRNGMRNYGNAYHVANSIWHSIHHPITEDMMKTGRGIPGVGVTDDDNENAVANDVVYYQTTTFVTRKKNTMTGYAMRDFHNMFVKNKLIRGLSRGGSTLCDLAVGKAGDLPKWIDARVRFVLGVDVVADNILNRIDGACARYLNSKKRMRNTPDCLFVIGDSSKGLLSGEAYTNDKSKTLVDAIIGKGAKDANKLGKLVHRYYGVGSQGFNVVSCQFAIHYFFENKEKLMGFLKNVAQMCAVGGYFVGVSYDGKTLYNRLRNKAKGQSIAYIENNGEEMMDGAKPTPLFEITKQYEAESFADDITSLGYAIDVYHNTFTGVFREYLVNFDYLNRLMENFGFVVLPTEEAKSLGFRSGSGLFRDMWNDMSAELAKKVIGKDEPMPYGRASKMTDVEKDYSFMNRYFIYKKIRNVNMDNMDVLVSENVSEAVDIEEELAIPNVVKPAPEPEPEPEVVTMQFEEKEPKAEPEKKKRVRRPKEEIQRSKEEKEKRRLERERKKAEKAKEEEKTVKRKYVRKLVLKPKEE